MDQNATLLDSQQRSSMRINSLQQQTNARLEETQKLQKMLPVPWWCYLLLLGLPFFEGRCFKVLKQRACILQTSIFAL